MPIEEVPQAGVAQEALQAEQAPQNEQAAQLDEVHRLEDAPQVEEALQVGEAVEAPQAELIPPVGTLNTQEKELQDDLKAIFAWAEQNTMGFNDTKFEMMRYGSSNRTSSYKTPTGLTIQQKRLIKDLGILFDEKLLFHDHVTNIASKGHRVAGWILRIFRTRATVPMLTLLKAIVVASMEYACVVWSPTKQRDIDLLENVQRRFTSRFGCFLEYNIALGTMQCTVNYPERLRRLNIFSLQRRRERYLIIYMYKIIIVLFQTLFYD
jgi:hypothetical protein